MPDETHPSLVHASTDDLLPRAARGDQAASHELVTRLFDTLRHMARGVRDPRVSLDSVAIMHEAWIRVAGERFPRFEQQSHFIRAMAQAMRHALVDYVRARRRAKRGGTHRRLPFDVLVDTFEQRAEAPLDALSEALDLLRRRAPRAADVVELRFFGGLEVAEVAHQLGLSERTVYREWEAARAWLREALREEGA